MKNKQKHIVRILIAAGIIAAAAALFFFIRGRSGGGGDTAAVEPVSDFTGGDLSAANRFSGVVEPQDTWSIQQNPDSTIA